MSLRKLSLKGRNHSCPDALIKEVESLMRKDILFEAVNSKKSDLYASERSQNKNHCPIIFHWIQVIMDNVIRIKAGSYIFFFLHI